MERLTPEPSPQRLAELLEDMVGELHYRGCTAEHRLLRQAASLRQELLSVARKPGATDLPLELNHLQPLRIPEGWHVAYNQLYRCEFTPDSVIAADTPFTQDLLQLHHAGRDRLLDLGFAPEGDFEHGQFYLSLFEGDCSGRCLVEIASRDLLFIICETERLLAEVSLGQ